MTRADRPRLVLVPGLGLTAEAWAPALRHLAAHGIARARVEVTALPGYGLPARRGQNLEPAVLARSLLDRCPPGRLTVLAGHSASCQVVAHAAAQAPDRVVGLILVGPTTDPRAGTWPSLVVRWLRTAAHEPPRQVPSLLRQYSRTGLCSAARAMDAARQDRVDRALRGVECPVLLLRGRRDRIVPQDWLSALARTRPEGRRTAVTLERGAHMVPLVHGDLVARAIGEFVD
jgi:pimeloyl-ACP methyl ester carboxylesterase